MQKWYALYVSLYSYLIEKKVCGPDMQSGRAYWAVSSHLASRKSIRQFKYQNDAWYHIYYQKIIFEWIGIPLPQMWFDRG